MTTVSKIKKHQSLDTKSISSPPSPGATAAADDIINDVTGYDSDVALNAASFYFPLCLGVRQLDVTVIEKSQSRTRDCNFRGVLLAVSGCPQGDLK